MQISFSKQQGRVPVTLMHLTGNVDASNYTDVITHAQESFDEGIRDLLIDLSNVPYISSAGLMSLHTIVMIFSGQALQSKENGRPIFRSLNSQRDSAGLKHVKLLTPQFAVEQALEVVGLTQFLEVHKDIQAAVQSF
jgi:anti-anti-sigma regulatory factor